MANDGEISPAIRSSRQRRLVGTPTDSRGRQTAVPPEDRFSGVRPRGQDEQLTSLGGALAARGRSIHQHHIGPRLAEPAGDVDRRRQTYLRYKPELMSTYVILLRGINVGGKNNVAMAALINAWKNWDFPMFRRILPAAT